jgi:hypothetical protein
MNKINSEFGSVKDVKDMVGASAALVNVSVGSRKNMLLLFMYIYGNHSLSVVQ